MISMRSYLSNSISKILKSSTRYTHRPCHRPPSAIRIDGNHLRNHHGHRKYRRCFRCIACHHFAINSLLCQLPFISEWQADLHLPPLWHLPCASTPLAGEIHRSPMSVKNEALCIVGGFLKEVHAVLSEPFWFDLLDTNPSSKTFTLMNLMRL